MSRTVIPKDFERLAQEAGIDDVKVNQTRYRWLDPNEQGSLPVTRQRIMESIGQAPYSLSDAFNLKAGRLLPPPPNAPKDRYVKVGNNEDGTVRARKALSNGMPDTSAPLITLSEKDFRR